MNNKEKMMDLERRLEVNETYLENLKHEIELLKSNRQSAEKIIIDGLGVYKMRNGLKAFIFSEQEGCEFEFFGLYETGGLNGSGYTDEAWSKTGRFDPEWLSEFDIIEKIEGYDD